MKARRNMRRNSAALRRAAGRWLAPAIGVTAALWGLAFGPVQAQQFLACGVPVAHHLASGETDTYQPAVSGGVPSVVDVIDTSGTIGLLQLSPAGCSQPLYCAPPTCTGSEDFGGPVVVSDCVGNDAGDYTIEFNVVGQSPENCGIPLSCGAAPANTALSIPGEVDAYTFAGVIGQQVSLTATATSGTTGSLRMRLYDPFSNALLSDSCAGTLTFNVQETGTYTVLVSACITPLTGPYTIVWQTLPACPAPVVPAFAYVVYPSPSRTVGVIDLTTNQTVSIVPGVAPSAYFGGSDSSIAVSPNNGFVYVTTAGSSTISIINTTLNRVVGSINVPVSFEGGADLFRVAIDPEGRYAYAPSDVLGGVAVIDTARRKIDAVIPVEGIHVELGFAIAAPIAVSPDGKSVYVGATSRVQSGEGHCVGGSVARSRCTGDSDCTGGGVCAVFQEGLIVIDTASRTVTGRVTDPRFGSYDLLDISFNPTATLAYVTSTNALSVVDTASGSITQSLPLAVTDIAYSHDGRVGYAVGCAGTEAGGCADPQAPTALLVIDVPSLTIINTVPLSGTALYGSNSAGVALSPDGGRLLVTSPDAHTGDEPGVAVIDTATLQIVATIPATGDGPWDVAIVTPPTGLCTADDSGQARVTVGELVTAVNYSVDGCPTARTSGFTAR